jgi:hypothetical protein
MVSVRVLTAIRRPPRIEVLGRDPCPHGRTRMPSIPVSAVEGAISSLITQLVKS